MPLHPSVDLLRLHWFISDFENQLTFVDVNKASLLAFPDDCFHLLRFNVLVLPPLADACSVLPYPAATIYISALEV
jgi:hypothetical protein